MILLRLGLAAVAVAAIFGVAAPAQAELLQLRAEVHGGVSAGQGLAGEQQDEAFFDGATGAVYGASVGAEVFFVDAWVEHNQYVNGDGLVGTWTQFMVGLDMEIPLGAPSRDVEVSSDGGGELRERGGYSPTYAEVGLGFGFGVGTGQQVEPPLDRAQLSDRGFLVQAHVGLGYRLNRVLSLGVTAPVQYGYMFKSGVANDVGNHYQSVQGAVLANVRMSFSL